MNILSAATHPSLEVTVKVYKTSRSGEAMGFRIVGSLRFVMGVH